VVIGRYIVGNPEVQWFFLSTSLHRLTRMLEEAIHSCCFFEAYRSVHEIWIGKNLIL
jgi:hypothetical protein